MLPTWLMVRLTLGAALLFAVVLAVGLVKFIDTFGANTPAPAPSRPPAPTTTPRWP